jgi:hypothetical protein
MIVYVAVALLNTPWLIPSFLQLITLHHISALHILRLNLLTFKVNAITKEKKQIKGHINDYNWSENDLWYCSECRATISKINTRQVVMRMPWRSQVKQ